MIRRRNVILLVAKIKLTHVLSELQRPDLGRTVLLSENIIRIYRDRYVDMHVYV